MTILVAWKANLGRTTKQKIHKHHIFWCYTNIPGPMVLYEKMCSAFLHLQGSCSTSPNNLCNELKSKGNGDSVLLLLAMCCDLFREILGHRKSPRSICPFFFLCTSFHPPEKWEDRNESGSSHAFAKLAIKTLTVVFLTWWITSKLRDSDLFSYLLMQ